MFQNVVVFVTTGLSLRSYTVNILLAYAFYVGLLLNPEDEGGTFLRNIGCLSHKGVMLQNVVVFVWFTLQP
jgi:hypothetical protein